MSEPLDLPEDVDVLVFRVFQDSLDKLEHLEQWALLVLPVFQEIQASVVLLELLEREVCTPRFLTSSLRFCAVQTVTKTRV